MRYFVFIEKKWILIYFRTKPKDKGIFIYLFSYQVKSNNIFKGFILISLSFILNHAGQISSNH